jgi:hypothetical protein
VGWKFNKEALKRVVKPPQNHVLKYSSSPSKSMSREEFKEARADDASLGFWTLGLGWGVSGWMDSFLMSLPPVSSRWLSKKN